IAEGINQGPLYIINTWSVFNAKQIYIRDEIENEPLVYTTTWALQALLRMLSRSFYRQNSCVFAPNIFGDDNGNDTQTSSSRQDIALALVGQSFNQQEYIKY
ncbi:unnamed protein product, partial [Medioppia subpectinata]